MALGSDAMTLRTRQDYETAFAIVREAISRWDPDGLLGGGAPPDEWDSEVAKVVAKIPRMTCGNDVAEALSAVFAGPQGLQTFQATELRTIGAQLFDALSKANLLAGSSRGAT